MFEAAALGGLDGATFGLARQNQTLGDLIDQAQTDEPLMAALSGIAGGAAVPTGVLFGGGKLARALRNMGRTEKIAGPVVLQHGAKEPWIMRGARPDLDRGEGFGMHAGTKAQAKDRLNVPGLSSSTLDEGLDALLEAIGWNNKVRPRLRAPTLGHGYVDEVRFGPGREIQTPDLGSWSSDAWRGALKRGEIKGLTPLEEKDLAQALDDIGGYGYTDQRRVRKALQDLGVQRVRYVNEAEGPGRYSYAAIDPDIIAPSSLAARAAKAGLFGGIAAVAAPVDAMADDPRENLFMLGAR